MSRHHSLGVLGLALMLTTPPLHAQDAAGKLPSLTIPAALQSVVRFP